MPELKLAKLPDRTPVKITLTMMPDLNNALKTYAELYRDVYGKSETVAELIPYMLHAFLDGDRGFAKATKKREGAAGPSVIAKAPPRSSANSTAEPANNS